MTTLRFDVTPFLSQDEGQHFERKSLFAGPESAKKPRDRKTIRDEVARYVAAFANAEGGVLILGIEDDGRLTGHKLPSVEVEKILTTPERRLSPPQTRGFVVEHLGVELLVFDVGAADSPVQVEGNGFPLRIGDATHEVAESKVQQLKFRGLVESWESLPSPMKIGDLDAAVIAIAKAGGGLGSLSDEDYLLRRKLADRRGPNLVLRRAAELLFAKNGPEHPNAGTRIFRVVGAERRLGAEHNVDERPRIEGHLTFVLDETFAAIESFLRRPKRLVGHRFREVPEYPEFSWKESILNAIAHRDYAIVGRTTEIWFFDDRLEVLSPGGLLPEVSIEDLVHQRRVHVSRNPRIVRVLVDFGFMRDQGEGIPRMFAEMEGIFLPDPVIAASTHAFCVTLRNTPTLTAADHDWIASLGGRDLSDHELRALLEAHRKGRIDNARLREMTGLDVFSSSVLLRRLRERELLESKSGGGHTHYVIGPAAAGPQIHERRADGEELAPDGGELGVLQPSDGGELGVVGGESPMTRGDGGELPRDLRTAISKLGKKPRAPKLRALIRALAENREWRASELARVLGWADSEKLVEKHLTPMVREGVLERTREDSPTHPEQAYRAKQTAIASGSRDEKP